MTKIGVVGFASALFASGCAVENVDPNEGATVAVEAEEEIAPTASTTAAGCTVSAQAPFRSGSYIFGRAYFSCIWVSANNGYGLRGPYVAVRNSGGAEGGWKSVFISSTATWYGNVTSYGFYAPSAGNFRSIAAVEWGCNSYENWCTSHGAYTSLSPLYYL